MLRKKLVVSFVLLLAVGMLSLGAAPAFADPDPCPPNFFLTPPAPGDEHVDRNGNGLICIKIIFFQTGGHGGGNSVVPGVVVKDDKLDND